jgi:hypothetical protein
MQRISVILNARAGWLIGQDSREIAGLVERALRAPARRRATCRIVFSGSASRPFVR